MNAQFNGELIAVRWTGTPERKVATQVQKVQQRALQVKSDFNGVTRAARKYHIPVFILWGVYGIESNFGQNLGPSSAGARGPFQFLPSTGAEYGLNSTTINQFGPSADAAAHYLSDLYKQSGKNWDKALRGYSGGGYGLSEVQKKAHSNAHIQVPSTGTIDVPNPVQAAKDIVEATQNVASAIQGIGDTFSAIGDFLIHPKRLLKLIFSGIILFYGISKLSGSIGGPHPAGRTRYAARGAARGAATGGAAGAARGAVKGGVKRVQ